MRRLLIVIAAALLLGAGGGAHAALQYLNDQNITVALGSSMAPEPFSNRSTVDSLASIIDAPSAAVSEEHNQSTHVWINGGTLELDFDLGTEYDLTMFHFWNYFGEDFDVDDIDFAFFDTANNPVGSLLDVVPALGGNPIFAEDYMLSFPSNVQFVNAVLSGTNDQVDFNNMGFTGELSSTVIPEPSTWTFFTLCAAFAGLARKRNRRKG